MQNIINNQYIIAIFIARLFLGFLFFFQGYDAIVRVGIKNLIETLHLPLSEKGVPKAFTIAGVWLISCVQLIGGVFLIIGFVKYYVLYLLGINLVIASIVYGSIKPMWDMQFVFPRLVILIFLLIVPSQWDVLSVDYFWSFFKFLKTV